MATGPAPWMDRESPPGPCVFIVGVPRSGTTLLRRMVDAHPHFAITPSTHWVTRLFKKRTGLTPDGPITLATIAALRQDRKFMLMGVNPTPIERAVAAGRRISHVEFASRIYDLYRQREGKPAVGDKTPKYVRHIPLLHRLWPEARFVHLVRDGRDVGMSVMQWRKWHLSAGRLSMSSEDPVSSAAIFWAWNLRLGLEGGRPLGPDLYYEMRYEALVQDPEGECGKLCLFLGVPYADAMVRFHEGRTKTQAGLSPKDAWLPTTPGLRDWRSQMPAGDIERFEAVAGDLLDELGYPRGAPKVSARARAHGARMLGLFDHRPLPRAWPSASLETRVG